jgi:hypothetical protein
MVTIAVRAVIVCDEVIGFDYQVFDSFSYSLRTNKSKIQFIEA